MGSLSTSSSLSNSSSLESLESLSVLLLLPSSWRILPGGRWSSVSLLASGWGSSPGVGLSSPRAAFGSAPEIEPPGVTLPSSWQMSEGGRAGEERGEGKVGESVWLGGWGAVRVLGSSAPPISLTPETYWRSGAPGSRRGRRAWQPPCGTAPTSWRCLPPSGQTPRCRCASSHPPYP